MCVSFDPFDIDDCRDASSIRERLKILEGMQGYFLDQSGRIKDAMRDLENRLAALGEE